MGSGKFSFEDEFDVLKVQTNQRAMRLWLTVFGVCLVAYALSRLF